MLEILNEDSLFFFTYASSNYPEAQLLKQEKRFGDWLAAKYGSVDQAFAAWGGQARPRDKAAEGRAQLENASTLGTNVFNRRHADQILFFDHVHREFYTQIGDWLKGPEIGYKGLIVPSNWRTASYRFLQDMEYHGYTAGDVIDTHFYFTPYLVDPANSRGAPAVGRKFYGIPAVMNPRRLPLAVKQVVDYPYTISEVAWDSPSNFRAEAPILIAAYAALSGVDGVFWFNNADPGWELGSREWQLQVPSTYGQFPAAALIFRRGMVAPATTVVREGRTIESLSRKEQPLVQEFRGFDPLRDSAPPIDPNPSSGVGTVDPAAALVGRVEVGFATDSDYTDPHLTDFIDNESGLIRSATGEIELDSTQGLMTINAPRVRAIVGHTNNAGRVSLGSIDLQLQNSFAAMALVSLDDLPVEQSRRLLLQTLGADRPRGWVTAPATLVQGAAEFPGEEIVSLGGGGWETEEPIGGRLTFNTGRPLPKATVLDTNGYALRPAQPVETARGFWISAPAGAAYLLLEWEEVPASPPTIATKNLPLAQVGTAYRASLSALDVNPESLTWALGDGAPSWLSLTANGELSGIPTEAESPLVAIEVTGTYGATSAQLPLTILTVDGLAPPSPLLVTLWKEDEYPAYNGLKSATIGWIYDGFFPWVFLFAESSRWLYVPPTATLDSLWLYDDHEKSWVWTSLHFASYYYSVNASEWRVF